jgi:hypothetical protein
MQPTSKPRVSQDLVAAARGTLEAIPPPPKASKMLSVKDAIKALTPTIRKLLQRGDSREQVVALLKEQGIECSLATLRSHYRVTPPRTTKASSSSTTTRTIASTRTKTRASTLGASSGPAANTELVTPRVSSPTVSHSPNVTDAGDQKGNGLGPIPAPAQPGTKAP